MRKRVLIVAGLVLAVVLIVVGIVVAVRPTSGEANAAAAMLRQLPQARWENLSAAARAEYPYLQGQSLPRAMVIHPKVSSFDATNADTSRYHRWDAVMTFTDNTPGRTLSHRNIALLKQENGSWKFYGFIEDIDPRTVVAARGELLKNESFLMLLTPAEKLQRLLYELQLDNAAPDVDKHVGTRFFADSTVWDQVRHIVVPAGVKFEADVTTYTHDDRQGEATLDATAVYPTGARIDYRVMFYDGRLFATKVLAEHGAQALQPTAFFATTTDVPKDYTTSLKVYADVRKAAEAHAGYRTNFYANLIAKADKTDNLSADQRAQIEQWRQELAADKLTGADLYPMPVTWVRKDATRGTIFVSIRPYPGTKDVGRVNRLLTPMTMVLDGDNVWRIQGTSAQ